MLTIVNSPALSEPTLLLFLSSGLVGLAQLVRRSLGCPLPKPQRLVVWIDELPEESQGEDFAHFVGNEELSWTTHEARGRPVHRRQERLGARTTVISTFGWVSEWLRLEQSKGTLPVSPCCAQGWKARKCPLTV
jgi:hypothetical protein